MLALLSHLLNLNVSLPLVNSLCWDHAWQSQERIIPRTLTVTKELGGEEALCLTIDN